MMSVKRLQYRLEYVLFRNEYTSPQQPKGHRHSYAKGHIRCKSCGLWIDPRDPEQIRMYVKFGKSGKKMHLRCPTPGMGGAIFSSVPKYHLTRRKWLDSLPRY